MDDSSPAATARAWPAWLALALLVAAALAVRFALMPFHAYLYGGAMDELFWASWMQAIHEHGVLNIFNTTSVNYVGYQRSAVGTLAGLRLGGRFV
jgi:hypothetical protein